MIKGSNERSIHYTIPNNSISTIMDIKLSQRSMDDLYLRFLINLEHTDSLLKKYLINNNRKKVKEAYKKYLEYPEIPGKTILSDREIILKTNYLKDHFPLIYDIRNDQEFETLIIIFGELRVSMAAKAHIQTSEIPFNKVVSSMKKYMIESITHKPKVVLHH